MEKIAVFTELTAETTKSNLENLINHMKLSYED